jgi:hypothetical protein
MSLEQLLTGAPVGRWKVGQAIAFDWYDGPRAGICRLAEPGGEFFFSLLDERPSPDDLDDRLFRLSELPTGSVDQALSALQLLGHPTGPVWIPVWRFPDEEARQQTERVLKAIEGSGRPTSLVLHTRDMTEFLGCWAVAPSARPVSDWFAELSLGRRQTA